MRGTTGRAWLATLAASGATFYATAAWGQECLEGADCTIGSSMRLDGDHMFRNVVIGTDAGPGVVTLSVTKYSTAGDAGAGVGWLRVRAHSIEIKRYGRIDASGAGYKGQDTGGTGYTGGAGETPVDPTPSGGTGAPAPGGGGGHRGVGGSGVMLGDCTVYPGANGGAAYTATSPFLDLASMRETGMGSSGGTGHSGINGSSSGRGGNGGGVIVLEAGRVVINGAIWANGESAPVAPSPAEYQGMLGSPAGGGAGGTVYVNAPQLTIDTAFTDPETSLPVLFSVRGGLGAPDRDPGGGPAVLGGGGGGGLVLIRSSAVTQAALEPLTDRAPGQHPAFGACTTVHYGQAGTLLVEASTDACLDLDEDGAQAQSCGGMDCNDGNSTMNPTAPEMCDLVDNNCSGEADEEPAGGIDAGDPRCSLGSGKVCVDGGCVEQEPPDASTETSTPDLKVTGGFCSSTAGLASGGVAGASALGALGVLVLARRGRRAKEGRQRAAP